MTVRALSFCGRLRVSCKFRLLGSNLTRRQLLGLNLGRFLGKFIQRRIICFCSNLTAFYG
ncbi:hypothetical protein CSUNSWCD_1274 [Campylobacter showae CSUNSWCD]|uniref:Uncharacterized protein n=1 Tax=Campylobacter showae CSUNSWCD TaxID=1244083 RepID=M5ILB3_9BACT|nr:hypothetical protein CSUNSWCD_1274 [Campylobacter showae CSUNSWCD]